jgi:hypothetical protein
VPGQDVGAAGDAGAVHVLYGSPGGLTAAVPPDGRAVWRQDSPGVPGKAEAGDQFGFALAAGDFNGDGEDDLAVGTPFEDDEDGVNEVDVGTVYVIHGVHTIGLTTESWPSVPQKWSQDTNESYRREFEVEGREEAGDWFGYALAAGNFDGDYYDDLAIGVPHESVDGTAQAGAVNVLHGDRWGLTSWTVADQLWHQGTADVEGTLGVGDWFGSALAAGDFNGDGRDDLAVGVPGEELNALGGDTGGKDGAGAVNVIHGSAGGLSATAHPDQYWNQDVAYVQDVAEACDHFGGSVAVGDFNGDGRDDLAVGVPGEDVDKVADAGAVNVIYGAPLLKRPTYFAAGLSATGLANQFWHQDSPGIWGDAEIGDGFGVALGRRK